MRCKGVNPSGKEKPVVFGDMMSPKLGIAEDGGSVGAGDVVANPARDGTDSVSSGFKAKTSDRMRS
eukprot:scaffold61244_cov31-Tisochrysis_lutea.AAC.3